jgi:hypothetical protein
MEKRKEKLDAEWNDQWVDLLLGIRKMQNSQTRT